MNADQEFAVKIQDLGRQARRDVGAADLQLLKRLKFSTTAAQIAGRVFLHIASGPWQWLFGTSLLGYYFSVEAQLNHSIMHGAYTGIPSAGRFTPKRYETLAVPFQSRTWGDAHRIHHSNPSLLELDPDTIHPLFRIHKDTPWRPWHLFNTFLGAIFTFENWAFDYDRFLKETGNRNKDDHREILKFLTYLGYNYALFPILAGARWKQVILGTLVATIIRNLIFTGLQTGSSVGNDVSTLHPLSFGKKTLNEWYRFQVETSKNFVIHGIWKTICGGLDRHIEHHLYPNLPPNRLYGISPEIKELCLSNGINYSEYSSFWGSLWDSLSYLWKLSLPEKKTT